MYREKRYDECINEVKSRLILYPNSIHLLNYLAMACSALERDNEALLSYQKIRKIDPTLSGPHYNIGIILKRNGRVEEAIDSYKRAIFLKSDYVQAYNNLGILYKDRQEYEDAIEMFKKAISLKSDYVQAYNNLGSLYKDRQEYEDAIEMFTKVKELQPDNHKSYFNLGLVKREQGLNEEAMKFFLKVLDLNPEHSDAKCNISIIKNENGLPEEAKKYLLEILETDQKYENAPKYLAAIALKQERFEEVWRYYEYRWKASPQNQVIWPFQHKPLWQGERGKRVSLWREQGIGDDIIFLSLVPEVKEMCKSLSVYVDRRLQDLCKRAMPEINFVKDLEELENIECDYHLPLGSVPGLIRNDISDFDRTVKGYMTADPLRVETIRNELKLKDKMVIGISWKSNNSLNKEKKSIQLKDMERIFSGLDVVLINLQYGDVDNEIREFKEATGIDVIQCASVDNREDLDGLAALIELCDLVVSTRNVTIYLAGALAKEAWVLLPYVPHFWWLSDRPNSIWYPSVSLYCQPKLDDWDSVYVSVRKDLKRELM